MTEYVKRAERALRSGQLRLAELYMRRGLAGTPAGRYWLARLDFCRAVERTGRDMTRLYQELSGAWGWPAPGDVGPAPFPRYRAAG